MASIRHFEDHHEAIFSDQTRHKLLITLLSLAGVACIALLFMLGKSM